MEIATFFAEMTTTSLSLLLALRWLHIFLGLHRWLPDEGDKEEEPAEEEEEEEEGAVTEDRRVGEEEGEETKSDDYDDDDRVFWYL